MSKVPEDALPEEAPKGTASDTFSEGDLEAARQTASRETRRQVEAEFAEKERQKRKQAQESEISEFCDKGIKEGKILPAWVKMGLKEFMLHQDADESIEFSEEYKGTALDWFRGFLAELPKVVEFNEIATREKDIGSGEASARLSKLVMKKMADNKELTYNAAFSEVQNENPGLAAEYAQEIKAGK